MGLLDVILDTDSIVGAWDLSEASGTTATDAVGILDGTYVGTPTLGVAGGLPRETAKKGVLLNGTSQYVSIPADPVLELANFFCMEVMFKRTDPTRIGVEGLISHGKLGFLLRLNAGIPALYTDGQTTVMPTSHSIRDTEWHHIVAMKSSTTARIYLDGMDISGTFINYAPVDQGKGLVLGARLLADDTLSSYFNGAIQMVAIYSDWLTSAQIAARWTAISTKQDSVRARRARFSDVAVRVELNDPPAASTVAAQRHRMRLFDKNSFYNRRLPEDHLLDPLTDTYVTRMVNQVNQYGAYMNSGTFSGRMYDADWTVEKIHCIDRNDSFLDKSNDPYRWGAGSEIPWGEEFKSADAEVAMTTYKDRNLGIYRPDEDKMWEFFSVHADHIYPYDADPDGPNGLRTYGWPNVSATHGGVYTNASRAAGFLPNPYGCAASGLSFGHGVFTRAELETGLIPHAVRFAVVQESAFRSPATRQDGSLHGGPDTIGLGTRFRLPYDFDIEAYATAQGSSLLTKIVMYAVRDYGMVASDGSGAVTWYMEEVRYPPDWSKTDPSGDTTWYTDLSGGQAGYTLFSPSKFPYSELQMLPVW